MNRFSLPAWLLAAAASFSNPTSTQAQDWPQWRGPDRGAKAAGFQAPQTWPKALNQKWKVTVGEGVATPALVGDRLYVFTRENGTEVLRCLNAADGKELWRDSYDSLGATGPAQGFSGPRSSPAVAEGKVVTVGVRGMISLVDAATGKVLWRKDDFKAYPNFFPSSSPLILQGLAIAQLGGRGNGAVVAYDLTTGAEKWKWNGPSPSYASPVVLSVGSSHYVVAQTESKLVAVDAATGRLAWESEAGGGGPDGPGGQGRGGGGGGGRGGNRDYKAATPIVDGSTLILAGRSIRAWKMEKSGDQLAARDLWNNEEKSVQFNTPTLKNGLLFGLSGANELFCVRAKDGTTAWTAPFPSNATPPSDSARPAAQRRSFNPNASVAGQIVAQADPGRPGGGQGRPDGPGGGRRGGGFGGGGGGRSGYGNIIDAGPALLAITPAGDLVVFEPSDVGLKVLASYKVSDGQTHAYPVLSGKRIFIKDANDLTLWSVD
ncbi:MAG: PQQ-binding-like beta-propeller repeat protein [Limisphaerales bacterium]